MNKTSCLMLFLGFFSTTVFCQPETCLQNIDHPGYNTITQDVANETIVREYILYVPKSYDAATSSSLVINMHGFGDCAVDYSKTVGGLYEFDKLADEENIIVAYPQGAYRPDKDDNYWEPGDNGSLDIYKNDVYFIEQLVAQISADYKVDQNKIYAVGYSNGGMLTYSLACNRSELFAAVGIMSGVMLEEDCEVDRAIPLIKFHGIADGVLPYDGNLWYQSVNEIINYWLDQNNIPESSLVSTDLNGGDVVQDTYFGTDDNSCLQLYTINEEYNKPGDHVWFSDEIEGVSPNTIIMDFLFDSCSSLSSNDEILNSNSEFIIQPNPFTDRITIKADFYEDQRFSIYNLQGQHHLSGLISSKTQEIDLGHLPANVYLLNIEGKVNKLIKTE